MNTGDEEDREISNGNGSVTYLLQCAQAAWFKYKLFHM